MTYSVPPKTAHHRVGYNVLQFSGTFFRFDYKLLPYKSPHKGIRIPKSGKFQFACGIRKPGLWKLERSSLGIRNPSSTYVGRIQYTLVDAVGL